VPESASDGSRVADLDVRRNAAARTEPCSCRDCDHFTEIMPGSILSVAPGSRARPGHWCRPRAGHRPTDTTPAPGGVPQSLGRTVIRSPGARRVEVSATFAARSIRDSQSSRFTPRPSFHAGGLQIADENRRATSVPRFAGLPLRVAAGGIVTVRAVGGRGARSAPGHGSKGPPSRPPLHAPERHDAPGEHAPTDALEVPLARGCPRPPPIAGPRAAGRPSRPATRRPRPAWPG
jgi:hypothetical protein